MCTVILFHLHRLMLKASCHIHCMLLKPCPDDRTNFLRRFPPVLSTVTDECFTMLLCGEEVILPPFYGCSVTRHEMKSKVTTAVGCASPSFLQPDIETSKITRC